jgi:hypothetical protein
MIPTSFCILVGVTGIRGPWTTKAIRSQISFVQIYSLSYLKLCVLDIIFVDRDLSIAAGCIYQLVRPMLDILYSEFRKPRICGFAG